MRTLLLTIISVFTLFIACTNSTENQANKTTASQSPILPAGVISAAVEVSAVNCWVEQGQFLVTGVCDNRDTEWEKIWLKMIPLDAKGRRLIVSGDTASIFPTFSDAVPPLGRTSFFVSWPLTAFSGTPETCIVEGAAMLPMGPGPILVSGEQSGVRILVPAKPGDTATIEKAWQVNVTVENPLDLYAYHPRVELLLYGKDKRLWFATVLNPEDPQQKEYVSAEREGAIEPKGRMRIGATVYYDNLPAALKEQYIGRIEFQPFDARQ
ncbi:MAG: hypothetical protein DYG98_18840 [Haliscomenobacteraceae bacterium CHB4]|nr:hypothetical protein [Saprospiraceae bacterium]MCE7925115.1 hypothetical protein [Haliscomenobacteraceae bacterium CHB4]